MSPFLPPPFIYRGGVLLGRQLRALYLETELEKRKKKSGVSMSVSVPRVKGDRVGTGQRIGKFAFCILQMFLWGVVLFWGRILLSFRFEWFSVISDER